MTTRCVRRRRLWKRGEHCRLLEIELTDAATEEIATRRLHTVHAVAQVDDVEVELEDLLLRQRRLDQTRQPELGEFLSKRTGRISSDSECIARHLHRDGAEALARAASFQVGDDSARESAPIESTVLVEPPILGRDEGLLNEHRYDAQRNIYPPDELQPSHDTIVAIENPPALVGL